MPPLNSWGLIKIMGPFGPLNNKEYSMIKTPKGPKILINPQLFTNPAISRLCSMSRSVPACFDASSREFTSDKVVAE